MLKKQIRIFIPNAGPLISLAMGDALDFLPPWHVSDGLYRRMGRSTARWGKLRT